MAARPEIRDYSGDFEDVAAFVRRVWIDAYGGKMWFPLWDADYLRWQLGAHSGALRLVAYDGTKLVASVFCTPYSLRVGSCVFPIGLGGLLTVDPEYRHGRLTLRMIEAMRQHQKESGLAVLIGVSLDDPGSAGNRFWDFYAKAFPQNFRYLFPVGLWGKVLAPEIVVRASIHRWERLLIRTQGRLIHLLPRDRHFEARRYQPADLPACTHLIEKASSRFEWALIWSPKQLTNQLEGPMCHTLVLERNGELKGMVNCCCLTFFGREPIRVALIELWADDNLSFIERMRLLGQLCQELQLRGIHIVLAARSAMMPATAFIANFFVPAPGHAQVSALFAESAKLLVPPKTWSLVMR